MKMTSEKLGTLLILAENINRYILRQNYKYAEKKAANRVYKAVMELQLMIFGDKDLSEFDSYVDSIAKGDRDSVIACCVLIESIIKKYDNFNEHYKQLFKLCARIAKQLAIKDMHDEISIIVKNKFKAIDEN